MSSFTAPGVLPMTEAMSSIFMSSWNLRTIAVRCGPGSVSTTAQMRRISSRWAAISSIGASPVLIVRSSSMSSVMRRER